MSKPIILSIFDYTGKMIQPWLDAGHECWIVDIQHPAGEHRDGNLVRVGADLRTWLPPRRDYLACFAFPPCTDLAVSGARWFQSKGLSRLSDAIELFGVGVRIVEWTGAPGFAENPVSTISSYYRKPDYIFDPCDFGGYLTPPGDEYTKKTCLWASGGFELPEKKRVEPVQGSKMHLIPPGKDRANLRSETPMGFAQAVYESLTTKARTV